jgi:hypothetical protein
MKIIVAGTELRGDLIRFAVMRNDAVPIPVTLEAEIRVDESIKSGLEEGQVITVGQAEDKFYIIKSIHGDARMAQGDHDTQSVKITALLENCYKTSFVQDKAIVKEKPTLSQCYKASGATLQSVDSDFPIDRFMVYVGESPTFHISRALQENGGIIRWKKGKMKFFKLPDLFKQEPVIALPDNASQDIKSGFSERHAVQSFYSLDENGKFVYGNKEKARSARFMPFMNEQQLRNLTRCLVQRKIAKIYYNEDICAGDLVNIVNNKPLVVVTSAHVYTSGTDGGSTEQYTKLWLSELSE